MAIEWHLCDNRFAIFANALIACSLRGSSKLPSHRKTQPPAANGHARRAFEGDAVGETQIEMLADRSVESETSAPHFHGPLAGTGIEQVALAVVSEAKEP